MIKGKISSFDEAKGFGFIWVNDNSEDVFIHKKNINNFSTLKKGQNVIFDTEKSEKGIEAINLTAGKVSKPPELVYSVISLVMLAMIFLMSLLLFPTINIWSYLISISLVTFVLYGYDKSIAGKQEFTRVPENVLHGLLLVGGTVGAILGQVYFRHKTKKASFKLGFIITILIQLLFVYIMFLLGIF